MRAAGGCARVGPIRISRNPIDGHCVLTCVHSDGRLRWASLALALVLCGCGSQVEGTPAPAADAFELFDPCEVIPPEAVVAAGAEPEVVTAAMSPPTNDFRECTWRGDWFFLTVQSTTLSLSDIRQNPNSVDIQEVRVAERGDALRFRYASDTPSELCALALNWSFGVAIVVVSTQLSERIQRETCVMATDLTNVLAPHIPT